MVKNITSSYKRYIEVKLKSDLLRRAVLKCLKRGYWPADCIVKFKTIKDKIISFQNHILAYNENQKLDDLLTSYTFDIRNRIYTIEMVFINIKDNSYDGFALKERKLGMLKQTKMSNLSKLPPYKIIMAEMSKVGRDSKLFSVDVSIDNILQYMFLNFLNILVERKFKDKKFGCRKIIDKKGMVSSIYAVLNRNKHIQQTYINLLNLKKCVGDILHSKILKYSILPKKCNFLLLR